MNAPVHTFRRKLPVVVRRHSYYVTAASALLLLLLVLKPLQLIQLLSHVQAFVDLTTPPSVLFSDIFLTHSKRNHQFCVLKQSSKQEPTKESSPLHRSRLGPHQTQSKNKNQSNNKISDHYPENEFSRTVSSARILATRRRNQNDRIALEISANEQERSSLALRFGLVEIAFLSASIQLSSHQSTVSGLHPNHRRRGGGGGGGGNRNSYDDSSYIYVEGTISATVTQTCVRTGENFPVSLNDVSIVAVVRPLPHFSHHLKLLDSSHDHRSTAAKDQQQLKSSKKNRQRTKSVDASALLLQGLLEDEDSGKKAISIGIEDYCDDGDNSSSVTFMEDGAIYSNSNSMNSEFDVGELVSQLFWLQLDPYPKKPGSTPILTSVRG